LDYFENTRNQLPQTRRLFCALSQGLKYFAPLGVGS
jgi:hypothetical protein